MKMDIIKRNKITDLITASFLVIVFIVIASDAVYSVTKWSEQTCRIVMDGVCNLYFEASDLYFKELEKFSKEPNAISASFFVRDDEEREFVCRKIQ